MSNGRDSHTRRTIDWADVHRRLDRVTQALERGASPADEQVQRILAERAHALAQPAVAAAEGEVLELIEFVLSGERYGFAFEYVREVCPVDDLTILPCTPPFVLGIVNVRGEIVSVVDLRKFFELPEKGLSDLNKVIVLRSAEMTFGVLADAVTGVRALPRRELRPALATHTGLREEYLLGVTGEPLAVLDAERLLGDPRMVVEETVA